VIAGGTQPLGPSLAMAAGICAKFDHASIVRRFDSLHARNGMMRRIALRLAETPREVSFEGLAEIRQAVGDIGPNKVILAGSLLGYATATLLALSSLGLKIATVFWNVAPSDRLLLERAAIRLIDMRSQGSGLELFKLLRRTQAAGYVVALRCDAPGRSNKRHKFLGYDVKCATLIEAYARVSKLIILPIEAELLSDQAMTLSCRTPLREAKNATQNLLSQLEQSIYENPLNYSWASNSVIFSSDHAVGNALSFLPDILAWRDGLHPAQKNAFPP
jgi:hypothetical protein